MNKISISDVNFRGRKVLVRSDLNVPLDSEGRITDDRRIREALPTLQKIMKDGGIAVVCTHLGRPGGRYDSKLSLKPVAVRLSELLDMSVMLAEDCIGPEAANVVKKLQAGDCLLLENLRFHAAEEANDKEFAGKLASLADIFVNDAFGSAHRAHASTVGVTRFFNQSVAGFLMKKELKHLGMLLSNPDRPFAAILGGAKISGKIDVIKSLMNRVDLLLIGGGMMFTFARALGYETGRSLLEEDRVELAAKIMSSIKSSRAKLILPVDTVVASEISDSAESRVVDIDKIPPDMIGLDIGPQTIKLFSGELKAARTLFWNGPMGLFESKPFAAGTYAITKLLVTLTEGGATTIVGGGDSAAAVAQAGFDSKLTHISTGGGASLELLEGKTLPGVAALTDVPKVEAI